MQTPELRFKADNGGDFPDWKVVDFNSLYMKNVERNVELEFDCSKTISIASMTFKEQGNGANEDSLATYKILRTGDIAFEGHENKEFRYGRFVLNDIGDGIMSPRFSCLRPKVKQIYGFWKYYIHSEQVMKHILVRSTKKGTMMHELVIPDFLKQNIRVPSIPEQQKIADFLSAIDTVIEKQQATVEAWEQRKKGVMQKLFSQEVRFKADDGSDFPDWEEKRLRDVSKRINRKNKDNISDIPLTISSVEGLIDQRNFFNKVVASKDMSGYYLLKKGEFAYNKSYSKGYDVVDFLK